MAALEADLLAGDHVTDQASSHGNMEGEIGRSVVNIDVYKRQGIQRVIGVSVAERHRVREKQYQEALEKDGQWTGGDARIPRTGST